MPDVESAGCMMARGVVLGATADGLVEVELDETSRCEGCAGFCIWRGIDAARKARVPARVDLRAGTPVLILLPQREVLIGALVLHGLPWAALLLGALAGALTTHADWGALLGGLGAVALAVLLTPGLRRRVERRVTRSFELKPLR